MANIITNNSLASKSQMDEVNSFLAQFEEIKDRSIQEIFVDWNVSPLINTMQRQKFLIWFKNNMGILSKLSNPADQDPETENADKIKEVLEAFESGKSIIFDIYQVPESKQSMEFNELTLILSLLSGQIQKSFRNPVSNTNKGIAKRTK